MGQHGPVRDPNSRRGQREARNNEPILADEVLAYPTDTGAIEDIFRLLVGQLVDAGLPVKAKDLHAIKTVAVKLHRRGAIIQRLDNDDNLTAEDFVKLVQLEASLGRDIMKDLPMIGATTVATLRLIKPKPKAAANPALEALGALQS